MANGLGIAYEGRTGAGGAQVFDTSDSAALYSQNLERRNQRIEADLRAAREAKAKAQRQQQEIFDVKIDGWDIDRQREIVAMRDDYVKTGINYMKNGVNPKDTSTKEGYEAFLDLQAKETAMRNAIDASTEQEKMYKQYLELIVKDQAKGDDATFDYNESVNNLAKVRNAKIADRNSILEGLGGDVLVVRDIDLSKDLTRNVLPQIRQAIENTQKSTINPDGSVTTTKVREFTEDDAKVIAVGRLQDPYIRKTVEKQFQADKASGMQQYDNVADWYVGKYITPFVQKELRTGMTKPSAEKGGIQFNFGGGKGSAKYGNYTFTYKTISPGGARPLSGEVGKRAEISSSGVYDYVLGKEGVGTLAKKISIENPQQKGEYISVEPTAIRNKEGNWMMVYEDQYNRQKEVPWEEVKDQLQDEFGGVTVEELEAARKEGRSTVAPTVGGSKSAPPIKTKSQSRKEKADEALKGF